MILATGMTAVNENGRNFLGNKGFTLLEVLIVVAIISIILSFAVISIDTEPEELNNEGKRLVSLMKLISEDSVLNSREHRAVFTRHGYGFQRLESGEWQELADGIFRQRKLPSGFSLAVEMENEPVLFDDDRTRRAAIIFLSSGEITPFTITIKGRSGLQTGISNERGEIETVSEDT